MGFSDFKGKFSVKASIRHQHCSPGVRKSGQKNKQKKKLHVFDLFQHIQRYEFNIGKSALSNQTLITYI